LLQTPSLMPLADRLTLAAAADVTLLLTGETGTGKTHLARLIHEHSPRRGQRLHVVTCGALSPGVVMSELFGHVKGAFTGADRTRVGKFEAAGSGTLLLDEIDALSLEAQAALLRVFETGEFEPLGSNDTQLCRARIIVASNWDLEEAVAQGKFREDLYYRLNVLPLHLPPLRERLEDIEALARGMVANFAATFGKALPAISPEALAALQSFAWPGNLRQLQNAIQQAVLLSRGPELQLEHLPEVVRRPPSTAGAVARTTLWSDSGSLAEHRGHQEHTLIERTLERHNYCRSRAARALGISRVTLYTKMKKYGLHGGRRGHFSKPAAIVQARGVISGMPVVSGGRPPDTLPEMQFQRPAACTSGMAS
jgi:DNA-binding NtrC family response regulator